MRIVTTLVFFLFAILCAVTMKNYIKYDIFFTHFGLRLGYQVNKANFVDTISMLNYGAFYFKNKS